MRTLARAVAACTVLVLTAAIAPAAPVGEFEGHIGYRRAETAAAQPRTTRPPRSMCSAPPAPTCGARATSSTSPGEGMTGDFILQARVELLGKGVDPHRKLGLDRAPQPGGGLAVRRRRGARRRPDVAPVPAHARARSPSRSSRRSRAPTSSSSSARATRTSSPRPASASRSRTREVAESTLGDEVYVGLFLCSHNPRRRGDRRSSATCASSAPPRTASCPTATTSAASSSCSTSQSGRRQVVHSSAEPFEAPNWTPDGTALIYNTSGRGPEGRGRLYRFDLATRQPALIDTGFANRNNNDHVLSFDGTMLGISDQSTEGGQSTIYTLPVERRHAEAHHAARAVLPARLVARREVAGLHRRPQRRVRHLQDRRPTAAARRSA